MMLTSQYFLNLVIICNTECYCCVIKLSCDNFQLIVVLKAKGAGGGGSFKASDLQIEQSSDLKPKIPLKDLRFGQAFTDHMLIVEYVEGEGWGIPKIKPFGFLPIHPAATVLHYGMCCFEVR